MIIEIHTDGGYANSIDQGGACAIIVENNQVIDKKVIGLKHTTNNRMELYGLLLGLEYILNSDKTEFNIYSDSQYVISTLTKGWKRKANLDIWKRVDQLLELLKEKQINYIWEKGHDGNEFNSLADILAVHASHINNVNTDRNE